MYARIFGTVTPSSAWLGIVIFCLSTSYAQVDAQRPDSIWAAPAGRYDAGFLHRLLLSRGHRQLWSMPVHADVLNLESFAGGLTPTGIGGGKQTLSLRLSGKDGRSYAFRSLDKDASNSLDPELRGTVAGRVLQDQIGSLLPLSALVVSPILDAAGVLHASPRLFVMPDDPRLGEYQATFGGMLGLLEERPNEGADGEIGFAGAEKVIGSDRLFEHLEDSVSQRIDDAGYVRARLIDFFVGDWDRHPDQWRWAGFPQPGGIMLWRPVPRDRDWALARMDGLLVKMAAYAFPNYTGFGSDYPSAFRLSWSGRALDRLILARTPRVTFDSVVKDLVPRLSDAVIENAVRQLPVQYYENVGVWLTASLKHRRDQLSEFSQQYYELLAEWVDLETTDERDVVDIERTADGRVIVEARTATEAEPFLRRTFIPAETREIRIDLHGGPDRVTVRGPASNGISLRIMGASGQDTLRDETGTGAGVHFYDELDPAEVRHASDSNVDTDPYEAPARTNDPHMARQRDWGSFWMPLPAFSYDPDVGFFIGGGAVRTGYGFRQFPYRDRLAFSAGVGTNAARIRAQISWDFPIAAKDIRGLLNASWSGAEVDNFFGFGNETENGGAREFYHAQRSELRFEALASVSPVANTRLFVGPVFSIIRHFQNPGTLVDSVAPYGFDGFDQAGLTARLRWDTRDSPNAARNGSTIGLVGEWFPAAFDVVEPFGSIAGDAAVHLSAATFAQPALSLRVGGEKLFGLYPYHQAAYIGGNSTLRGFRSRRFAGDASVFGNAELRLTLAKTYILLPGNFGLYGLADAGRVYLDGEDSNLWHSALGGGVWISFLKPINALTFAAVTSAEGTGLYIKAGFGF